MGLVNLFKDLLVCVWFLPTLLLLSLISLPFALWKISVRAWHALLQKQLMLLGPLETFFYGVDRGNECYKKPSRCMAAVITLDGHLEEKQFSANFKKEVLGAKDTDGKVLFARLQQIIRRRLGYLYFENDPNFQISRHIRTVLLPPGEESPREWYKGNGYHEKQNNFSTSDFLKDHIEAPFTEGSPLWEILIIHPYSLENKTVLFCRIHHTLMDGHSFLNVLKKCSAELQIGFEGKDSFFRKNNTELLTWQRRLQGLYTNTIAVPRKFMLEQKRKTLPKPLAEVFYYRRLQNIKLDLFKRLKNMADISFTEAILTATSFAMSTSQTNVPRDNDISTKLTFPLPKASRDVIGNNFILGHVELPNGIMTLDERIKICQKLFVEAKTSATPIVYGTLMSLLSSIPVRFYLNPFAEWMDFEGILISNTPGPSIPASCLGHRVTDIFYSVVAGPRNPSVFVSITSYNGEVSICMSGRTNLFKNEPDFEVFVESFCVCLLELLDSSDFQGFEIKTES